MEAANLRSLCGLSVSELYAYDSSSAVEPANFVRCSALGSVCKQRVCDCRNSTSTSVGYIPVCVAAGDACSGPRTIDCSSSSGTGTNSSDGLQSTTNSYTTELAMATDAGSGTGHNATAGSNSSSSSINYDNASTPSALSTPVIVAIVLVSVVVAALVSWCAREYCIKKHNKDSKHSSGHPNPEAPSPTMSATPSFPTFDRRTRTGSLSSGSGASRERQSAPRQYVEMGVPHRVIEARGPPGRTYSGYGVAQVYIGTRPPNTFASSQESAASGQGPKMQYADWVASGQPIRQVFEDTRSSSSSEDDLSDYDEEPIPFLVNSTHQRNGDSSVASFATTVEVPGRRRPTALQKRKPTLPKAKPRASGEQLGDSAMTGSFAWSSASDSSYFGSDGSSVFSTSSDSANSGVRRSNHEFEV